jgi:hypothetical protein
MDPGAESLVQLSFETRVIYWRGPAPFFFAPTPPAFAEELRRVAKVVSYGWGMVPVEATIGGFVFKTSLFPKDETYLLPLKAAVRRKTSVTAGDLIAVDLTIQTPERTSYGGGRAALI